MRNRDLLDFMSLADDKYINEADPSQQKQIAPSRAPARFKLITFLASACCLLLILNIVILVPLLTREDPTIPPPPINSEAGVSSGLNQIQNPSNDNEGTSQNPGGNTTIVGNEALTEALDKLFASGVVEDEISGGSALSSIFQGAIPESDIIKVSDSHIFYLRDKELCVYTIEKEDSSLASMLSLGGYIDEMKEYIRSLGWIEAPDASSNNYAYKAGWKMYLSPDQKTLTVVLVPGTSPVTGVLTFDVSRAPTVKLNDFKMVSGYYVSSQMVGDELLMFTRYSAFKSYKKDNPLTYMPFLRENGKSTVSQNIYFPNDISSSAYLMITRFSQESAKVNYTAAYLSYSDKVYVSEDNIYLTRRVFAGQSGVDYVNTPYNTEIAVVGYGDGSLTHKGTATVNGYINDQHSLDERDGILRIVTTSFIAKESQSHVWYETSASLFCIRLSSLELVARVEHFAPEAEVVGYVSFDEEKCYVYTSLPEKTADPVYVFDLSDLSDITYENSGSRSEISTSYVSLGNGYVVSIGVGSNSQALKIEAFKQEGSSLSSICTYELTNAYYPTDCQAYYIDTAKQLIGLAVRVYEASIGYVNKYLLLRFNGTGFEAVLSQELDYQSRDAVRGFYKNKYYYILTDTKLQVISIGNL